MNHPSIVANRHPGVCPTCDDERQLDADDLPARLNGAPDRVCPTCHCWACDAPIPLDATEFDALGRALCLECLADDQHTAHVANCNHQEKCQ